MSFAIKALGLNSSPVTIERLGNVNVAVWRAVCECGYKSKTYPRIGVALGEMTEHADVERVLRQERVVPA